jgi:hypothetical protein
VVGSAFCVLIIYPLIQDFNTEVQDLGGGRVGGGGVKTNTGCINVIKSETVRFGVGCDVEHKNNLD